MFKSFTTITLFPICHERVKKRAGRLEREIECLEMILSLITSLNDKRWKREIECLKVLLLVK